nr:type IV secretion protein Rhs [Fibrella sp. ES10-3-2-2]
MHQWSTRLLVAGSLLLFQRCSAPTQFSEMDADKTGLHFTNQITETEQNNIMTYEYLYNGGGVATGDVNNDGKPDVYLSGNTVPNKLFLNQSEPGTWSFTDVTAASGTSGRSGWKTGVTMADVNGDGWLDMYVCYSGNADGERLDKPVIRDHPQRANQLFINNGGSPGGTPTFTERAREYGLDAIGTFSTQAYFLDYDRDGDLDMFLLNHANMFYSSLFNVKKLRNLRHPYFGNKLFRNDNNRFVEVSEGAGIHGSGINFGLSAAISDLNADGWPDIYVTNDYDEQDFCYVNNQDGTFREVSHTVFGHLSKYGMGSDVADINNDGLPDLMVVDMLPEDNHRQKLLKGPDEYDKYALAVDSGYHHQYMRNTLQINQGFAPDSLPRFSEIGQLAGISNTDWSWSPLFADFDNDGLKDLLITNGYLKDYTNQDFIKYTVGDAMNAARAIGQTADPLPLISQMSSTKLSKYAFKNTDGTHFANVTEAWGLNRKAVSNASAYADFDNDGDLDLIVNNLNEEVTLLQNHQNEIQQNKYLKIKLVGAGKNTLGIGAKIQLVLDSTTICQEANFSRGYQSSVEPILTIGLGKAPVVREVRVRWANDQVSVLRNVKTNQLLVVEQAKAGSAQPAARTVSQPLMQDVSGEAGIDFRHVENNFVDFKTQQLLPYQLSRLGGKLAVADVNRDGNDDVFFGGAAGQSGQLYLGQDNGTFVKTVGQGWEADGQAEDAGALFFDADRDGDADLYVVSGGNEFVAGDPYYQDRLYLNDGRGKFSKASEGTIPYETTSGSCVKAADFDHDGDLDLFVGGRLAAQAYPRVPKSFILRNDSDAKTVRFTDVTANASEAISGVGMVTDASWTDLDRDGWPELLVVGEWMPVRVFHNDRGKLQEQTDQLGLADSQGWWCRITPADVDGDGDMDFLLGNAGKNMQFRASVDEPVMCHAADIDQDGKVDAVMSYYVQGKAYPLPTRDEMLGQVNSLRRQFIKYADYADATVKDIMGPQFARAQELRANTLESAWLENTGTSSFRLKPLPDAAQVSMVNGFLYDDFDGDGQREVLAAGNFYPYKVLLGRSDAAKGVLLKFGQGTVKPYKLTTPLWLTGDIRDMALLHFRQAPNRLIVSRNNDKPGVFLLKATSIHQ